MSDQSAGEAGGEPELSAEQEQMLRQMEEEMRRVSVQDLLAQSVVSILNLAYRRLAKEDERDLEQARVGIEAVRALVDLLDPEQQREIKNALSQIQMAYAQLSGDAPPGPDAPAPSEGGAPGEPGAAPGREPEGTGGEGGEPRRPPPGLWVPGSD